MPKPQQKPMFLLQARISEETEHRRRRLLKKLDCTGPQLVEKALRVLEEALTDRDTAA